jgi:PAS domain S-box-containing protein
MLDTVRQFFSVDDFMPHGMCYLWRPDVLSLHIISDALIALAYFSISLTLGYFVYRRKDLRFNWMFVCFAVFIVACGTTHLMEIWVIWHPTYWLSGGIKALTALVSVPTAVLLVKLMPQALRLPSPERLEQANNELQREIAERRRAEIEVRDSESRVRAVLDSALDGVIVMNAEGRITDWSAQAEVIFGWPKEEVLGRDLAKTIIPERYREAHSWGVRHFKPDGPMPLIHRLNGLAALRRDGSEFPIGIRVNCVKGAKTTTYCGFVTDLTERKRVQEVARSTQALLQAIIDNVTAIVYVKDVQGRYLMINRRFGELFHFTRESIVGKTDYDVFPKDAADAFRAVDERVRMSGTEMQMEESAPHDDGPHTYLSIKCPLQDSSGQLYAICGISTDITERKQSERKQRQQLAQLELLNRITRAIEQRQDLSSILQVVIRSLEEDMPIDFGCACLYEPTTNVLTVAHVGCRSQALGAEMMLTENSLVPIDGNGLYRCVRGELVYEPDISTSEYPFPQRLAQAGLRSLSIAPLVIAGSSFGLLVAARREANSFTSGDCEFLKQLSEHIALAAHQVQLYGDLQRAYEDLRQTQMASLQQERLRALGQMASGIAHDINNALSPAALYVHGLLERELSLSRDGRMKLETIQRAIDDVGQTVDRLREFCRPRDSQSEPTAVYLNRVVEQVLNLTRARWLDMPQERGTVIRVNAKVLTDLPPVLGSESEIRDALTNLVLNAVDAMPEGGTLVIRAGPVLPADGMAHAAAATHAAAQPPTHVQIDVSDTGIGMDESTRRRCLEPFFTTKGERGSGLGLAMVYGAIQRHGGEIEIESEPNKGTTVRLIFPVSEVSIDAGSTTIRLARPIRRLRILVVDDDPLLLKSMRDTLEADGHEVVVADGGKAGIETFAAAQQRGEPFMVVISDLGMPYVDGSRVAATVKGLSPSTPVMLVTGWGQRINMEKDRPLHVDRVLSKPPKVADVRKALAELTDTA